MRSRTQPIVRNITALEAGIFDERQNASVDEATSEPVHKSCGDHMPMAVFLDACRSGGFIDYDGYGHYASATHVFYGRTIRPSDVMGGEFDKNYTHVVWYNR